VRHPNPHMYKKPWIQSLKDLQLDSYKTNHIHLMMLKTFLILTAIASTFKLLVSSGHQVFVLLLVDLKGT